ncbi:MAG: CHAT domain-containing protein [Saprospiraceae bacterium]|nr:CHAT domain-containing protein [Saprospiraceae bacterium]
MTESENYIVALNNMADQLRKVGDYEQSFALFSQAVTIIEKEPISEMTQSAVFSNFSILLNVIGKRDIAIIFAEKALQLDIETENLENIGYSLHNVGMLYKEEGDHNQAINYLNEALKIRKTIGNHIETLATFEILSITFFEIDNYEMSMQYALEGLSLLEHTGLTPAYRNVLGQLALTEAKFGNWDQAIKYQLKAIELIEYLRFENRELANLDKFDARYNKQYLHAIELFIEAKQYELAFKLIETSRFRSGCDMIEGVYKFNPHEDFVSLLPEIASDELILMEWIYPKFDYSFSFSKSTLDHINFKKIITSTSTQGQTGYDLKYEWILHYENTLKQTQSVVDSYISQLADCKRLVIIPHGIQWQTPFAALKHPVTGDFLLETHQLVLLPSFRYAKMVEQKSEIHNGKHLLIGDPTSDLPDSREEVQQIAALLGCEPLVGEKATKSLILNLLAANEYDIIHFSCHGKFGDDGSFHLNVADGFITENEIAACNPRANLMNVVSCWSGMTAFSVWNELYGLPRVLLASNIVNIIGAAYPIGDTAAKEFSQVFYQHYFLQKHDRITSFQLAIKALSKVHREDLWGSLFITGKRLY